MKTEIEKMETNYEVMVEKYYSFGAFVYEDEEFEKTLGEREKRWLVNDEENNFKYSGEWLRGQQIKEGRGIEL